MPNSDEPPDKETNSQNLETKVISRDEGILLNGLDGNPVLNPAVLLDGRTKKILYRVRKNSKKPQGEFSEIYVDDLTSSTKVAGNPRILLAPKEDYDSQGVEDPRIFFTNGTAFIFTTGYDGLNARPFASVTKNFKDIHRIGLIGLNLPLEEAISLLPENSIYSQEWKKELRTSRDRKRELGLDAKIYPYDKDVCVGYVNEKWWAFHRFGKHIQLAKADNLTDFQDKSFWRNWVSQIDKHTVLTAEQGQLKIGLGQFPIKIGKRLIAPYHIVTGDEDATPKKIIYSGSFVEINPKTGRVTSRLKNPLLTAKSWGLREYDLEGREISRKKIMFPTALIQDPDNSEKLIIYFGKGDSRIGYRATSQRWLLDELSDLHNKLRATA